MMSEKEVAKILKDAESRDTGTIGYPYWTDIVKTLARETLRLIADNRRMKQGDLFDQERLGKALVPPPAVKPPPPPPPPGKERFPVVPCVVCGEATISRIPHPTVDRAHACSKHAQPCGQVITDCRGCFQSGCPMPLNRVAP